MASPTDPLDLNIIISDRERCSGTLSIENTQLGVMLLHARGYVVLKDAVPESLVTELYAKFKTMYTDNVQRLHAEGHRTRFIGEGENGHSVFWEKIPAFGFSQSYEALLRAPMWSGIRLRSLFSRKRWAQAIIANLSQATPARKARLLRLLIVTSTFTMRILHEVAISILHLCIAGFITARPRYGRAAVTCGAAKSFSSSTFAHW